MHKLVSTFLAAVFIIAAIPTTAFSDTLADDTAKEFELSRVNTSIAYKWNLGRILMRREQRLKKCKYDFALQGGAIGTANFVDEDSKACVLPKGAIIRDVMFDVITQGATSAAGTFAVTLQSAGDLKAALAAASWTGLVAGIPVGTAATAIKLTADRTLQGTIATGALTALKVYAIVEYVLSDST